MKKKVIIVSAVVAVLLTVAGAVLYFVPRLILEKVYGIDPKLCKSAKYITDFNNTRSDYITVCTDYYVVHVPRGYAGEDVRYQNSKIFRSQDNTKSYLIIGEPSKTDDITLMNMESYKNDEKLAGLTKEELEKVFNSLDYGLPDSCYNVFKCAALLDVKDFNMFDSNNVIAFTSYAIIKKSGMQYCYIYERDDIRALVSTMSEGSNKYYIEIFHKDNLNKSFLINVTTDEEDDIVKLLNSFEFIQE